jgi:hypothetical protein
MPLSDCIGMEMSITHAVEDGLRWTASHGLHAVDCRLDRSRLLRTTDPGATVPEDEER